MRIGLAMWALLLLGGGSLRAQIFEFHSGFWENLHQYLYAQATDDKSPPTGSAEWREAVDYYRRQWVKHNLLDDDMAAINNRLAHAENAATPPAGLDARLAEVLGKCAAEYRNTWWPKHDAANRRWIEAVRPLLAKHGAAMKDEIAAAFQNSWPAAPVRAEVSAEAGWAGAYTTNDPTLITVSSTNPDYQGDAALEMLFHEASHSLDEKLNQALSRELDAHKALFQRRQFGHAVLFYTAGEIARRHLGEYQQVGVKHGILERGWPGSVAVLEKDWKPYLDGKVPFADAVAALVRDYGVPKR